MFCDFKCLSTLNHLSAVFPVDDIQRALEQGSVIAEPILVVSLSPWPFLIPLLKCASPIRNFFLGYWRIELQLLLREFCAANISLVDLSQTLRTQIFGYHVGLEPGKYQGCCRVRWHNLTKRRCSSRTLFRH